MKKVRESQDLALLCIQCYHDEWKRDKVNPGEQGRSTDSSMHLSSQGEFGQDPATAVWPKGLSGPPLPLLPLRIEVGWIRLPSVGRPQEMKRNENLKPKKYNGLK